MNTSARSIQRRLDHQRQANEGLGNRLLEWHGGINTGVYSVGSCLLASCPVSIDEVIRAINELRNLKRHANFLDALDIEDELEASLLSNELEEKYRDQISLQQLRDGTEPITPRREA